MNRMQQDLKMVLNYIDSEDCNFDTLVDMMRWFCEEYITIEDGDKT